MTDVTVNYPAKSDRWGSRSIKSVSTLTPNSKKQRAALKTMTEVELLTGLTVEQLDAFHAEQRARVRARYGVAA